MPKWSSPSSHADLRDPKREYTYTLRQMIRRLFPFFTPHKKLFFVIVAFLLIKLASDVAVPVAGRGILTIIENYVKHGPREGTTPLSAFIAFLLGGPRADLTEHDLAMVLTTIGVMIAIFFGTTYFRNFLPMILISNVSFDIRRALYSHLQRMDLYFFNRTRTGEIASRLTSDIMTGVRLFGNTVSVIVYQALLFPFALYFMFRIHVPLTFIALGIGAVFLSYTRYFWPRMRERSRTVQEKLGRINGEVNEKFGAVKVTQSFTNEDHELDIFSDQIEEYRASIIHKGRLGALNGSLGQTIPMIGAFTLLGVGAHFVIQGQLSFADLTFFWIMRMKLFSPFRLFTHLSEQIFSGLGALDRVFEFFDTQPRVTDRKDALRLENARGSVEFRNVFFSYGNERDQLVLRDISMTVEPGQSIAFVGQSGAGKTTAVDLISRFYDPEQGEISIDGRDIRKYSLQSLRDNIGVVMQDAILFSGTIAENVRYGRPDAGPAEIEEALKMANAWNFIKEFREGLATEIGERGVTLSGGQKQRISIARAFLKNPRILILDEATSALDSVSELLVQEAIERLMRNRTTFVIAHRLSTIANVDKIVVFDRGEIVEEGTHEELLALDGTYAEFYNRQFNSFVEQRPSLI